MSDESRQAVLDMRHAYLAWQAVKKNPEASADVRQLALYSYLQAHQRASTMVQPKKAPLIEEKAYFDTMGHKFDTPSQLGAHVSQSGHPSPTAILNKEWLEKAWTDDKHPRDPQTGKFVETGQSTFTRQRAAANIVNGLLQSGLANSVDKGIDAEVLQDISQALRAMGKKYPFVKGLNIKHEPHRVPAVHLDGDNLYILGDAAKNGAFKAHMKECNDVIGGIKDYGNHLAGKSLEARTSGDDEDAGRFKRYREMLDEHRIKGPDRAYTFDDVHDAVIHEIGRKAHKEFVSGGSIDQPDDLRSAYRLGSHAARSHENYAAAAWTAWHCGGRDKLDERAQKFLSEWLKATKGSSL